MVCSRSNTKKEGKAMNKRWFRVLFRRRVIISALIVIQTAFLNYLVSDS